jgi:hypothetical protein
MRRTGFDQPIETEEDLTATGLIARIEHVLERMPLERREQERKAEDAVRRLAGYRDRAGQAFPLQGELDGKRAELAALEADLAGSAKQPPARTPDPALRPTIAGDRP